MILLTRILPTQSSFVAQCVEDLNVNVDVFMRPLFCIFLNFYISIRETQNGRSGVNIDVSRLIVCRSKDGFYCRKNILLCFCRNHKYR